MKIMARVLRVESLSNLVINTTRPLLPEPTYESTQVSSVDSAVPG